MKKIIKYFLIVVGYLAITVAEFGFIAPYLINLQSDFSVIMGVISIIVVIIVYLHLLWKIFKYFLKKLKE